MNINDDSHGQLGEGVIYKDLVPLRWRELGQLNLLLDMVTQLVIRETDIPETAPITLGAAGIEWVEQKPPKEGRLVELSLYLHHKYPRPFIVAGEVLSVTPVEGEGGKYLTRLVFKEMSEVLQAGLEKFIFRQHRRSIAQSRRAVNSADVIS